MRSVRSGLLVMIASVALVLGLFPNAADATPVTGDPTQVGEQSTPSPDAPPASPDPGGRPGGSDPVSPGEEQVPPPSALPENHEAAPVQSGSVDDGPIDLSSANMLPLPEPAEPKASDIWAVSPLAGANQYSQPVWWPLREPARIWCTYQSPGRCGGYHSYWALDIGAPLGRQIYAAGAGRATVYDGGGDVGCGPQKGVVIDHGNGVSTLYWHMSSILVSPGQWVDQNTVIGLVGTSGNVDPCGAYHLHYEKRINGTQVDPGPLQACFGSVLKTYPQENGFSSWRGHVPDIYYAHSDGTRCENPVAEGNFVAYKGDVYRIAGGAPVYVSDWGPFGAPQPVVTLNDEQWKGLGQYPLDGTRVTGASSGRVYSIAGGAPIYVTSYDNLPWASAIAVDDVALDSPEPVGKLSHIRPTPLDGFIMGYTSKRVYRVVNGHPYPIQSWEPYGGQQPSVEVDQASIDACDHLDCSPWGYLDSAQAGSGSIVVTGWAMDSESSAPVTVRLTVDGTAVADTVAARPRADVDAVFHRGAAFGFLRIVPSPAGRHEVCAVAVNSGRGTDTALGCSTVEVGAPVLTPRVERISGADRYSTAVAASRVGFARSAPVVYIATGQGFPDALSAAPAAIKQGGPLLLTPADGLPGSVRDEIVRLKPATIVVVGGETAVSAAVYAQLSTLASSVVRISGADRYATSNAIVNYAFPSATKAYVATGADFPDALSAAAAGGAQMAPVLLVNGAGSGLDPTSLATLARLHSGKLVVAGGTNAVSDAILADMQTIAPTRRLGGASRYETSQLINRDGFPWATRGYLATGSNFPDALAGATLSGQQRAPLYVVPTDCIPVAVYSDLVRLQVPTIVLMGGAAALDENVQGLMTCSF